MNSKGVGTASGCVVWLITFAVLSICMCSASMIVAGIVPVTNPRQVEALVDPILCPADSAATITHYATTIRDDVGADLPATGYEMHCITPAAQLCAATRAPSASLSSASSASSPC